jgi:hypothetical protein
MSAATVIVSGGTVQLTGAAVQLAQLLAAYQAEIARVRFGKVTFSFGGGDNCSCEVVQSLRLR